MRKMGISDLKPDSLCPPLHLSFTTFPALDGLYPPAMLEQVRLKPPITLVHWSNGSAPSTGSYL